MHINSHTKFQLPLSITSWGMKRGPKIQDSVAVVRMRHLAEKFSTCWTGLIISIYVPNFSFITQLLPEIWSTLFAIGLTLAPEMGFCFFPTRSRFFGVVWVFGYFLAKSDKIWVHGTETAVVMIFILLLVHLFRTTYRIFIVALRSSWYVTTNKLPCETIEYLPNKL